MKSFFSLAIALLILSGCEGDGKTNWVEAPTTNLTFLISSQTASAIVGDTLVLNLTASLSQNGSPLAGSPISFTALGNAGTILPAQGLTDATGAFSAQLRHLPSAGVNTIEVQASGAGIVKSASTIVTGYRAPSRIALTAPATKLRTPAGSAVSMTLSGAPLDASGSVIPGLQLSARLERTGAPVFGFISTPVYNPDGSAFTLNFNSDNGFGVEQIVVAAVVPGFPESEVTTTFAIEVARLELEVSRLEFRNLPAEVLLPDTGEVTLPVEVTASGSDDRPVGGVTVNFSASTGIIVPNAITDDLGIARVNWRVGTAGIPAVITAGIPSANLTVTDTLLLTNIPQPEISRIRLSSNDVTLIAGSGSTTQLTAIAEAGLFRSAPAGTLVNFEIVSGSGRLSPDVGVVDENGIARVDFIVGAALGQITLIAFTGSGDSRVESNLITFSAVSGTPDSLIVIVSSPELEPGESATITAILTDRYSNPVAGQTIEFESSLGSITNSALTNEEGRAVVSVVHSGTTGEGIVTVNWRELTANKPILFSAAGITSIEYSANPREITPYEPDNRSTISVRIKDRNGTSVLRPTYVHFYLINPPSIENGGCFFPNNLQADSAISVGGIATIELIAGEQIGGVLVGIRVYTDSTRTDYISTTLSTIIVRSGYPQSISLAYDSRGTSVGGGVWSIDLTVRAYDVAGNESEWDCPVNFTVEPAEAATVSPVEMVDGIAQTTLRYESSMTFTPSVITATIQGHDRALSSMIAFPLPLQRGYLTLQIDPQNWMFDRGRPDDTCLVRVSATLRDGHDILINNAPILFSTDRGRYFWRNQVGGRYSGFFPEPVRKYTGVVNVNHNEPDGVATVYLRGRMADFYLDDFTLEVTVHLEARVEGTDVESDPGFLFMIRH